MIDFLLNFLTQFAGGPGPPENNLVRFGLAALFWGVLLVIALSRQRHEQLPRERLLVWGFGLGLFRELAMLTNLSLQILKTPGSEIICSVLEPFEHALTLVSAIMIAGSFLRYILNDAPLAKRYLQAGFGAAGVGLAATLIWWPLQLSENPALNFHGAGSALLMHLIASVMIAASIVILVNKAGWLRNVVVIALSFLFVGEFLNMINFATGRVYSPYLCPIGNSFHIWAIPLFGFVYFREQSLERKSAVEALQIYRTHLEDLVTMRTEELTGANRRLQQEIGERIRAEAEIEARNAELKAQNRIAATISQTLDLRQVLDAALHQTLHVLGVETGCIYLLEADTQRLSLQACSEQDGPLAEVRPPADRRIFHDISHQAMVARQPVTVDLTQDPDGRRMSTLAGLPLKKLVCTPLVSQGRMVGTLTLGAGRTEALMTPQRMDLLTAIGQQIGMAVENARLYQQLEQAAALEERQRIAAEMHDGLAQTLSYLGLKTDQAAERLENGQIDPVLEDFYEIQEGIERAVRDVRRSITSLQESPPPRRSLQETLAELIDNLPGSDKEVLQPVLQDDWPAPLYLTSQEMEQVRRVVKEALHNASRHADAQQINIHLEKLADESRITIWDDGRGFDQEETAGNGGDHFGLSIMRARAARIDGRLEIVSEAGQGTRVILTWPLFSSRSKAALVKDKQTDRQIPAHLPTS